MKRLISISLTLVVGAFLLASCGSAGSTSCGDYRGKQTHSRLDVVRQMMSDRHLSTGTGSVIATELSVDAYCFTHAQSAHIDGIYSG
jgi:hypothetical protein